MKIFVAALILICSCLPGMGQETAKGWLGTEFEDLDKSDAEKLGWGAPRGVRLVKLSAGGPADLAGMQPTDILLSADGVKIDGADHIDKTVATKGPGTVMELTVHRQGREERLSIKLGTEPAVPAFHYDAPQLMLDTGGHMANVVDLIVTPDGKQLVSASNDKTVRVWDIETGKTVRMIRGDVAPGSWGTILTMAMSPDGRLLAVGGQFHDTDRARGCAIRIYDFASGKLVKTLKGHENVVAALAFSPDGRQIFSGSADKTAILWDVATGRQLRRLAAHAEPVGSVAFSKDGRSVVTGSDDESIRLWDAANGKMIAEMTEHKTLRLRERAPERWSASVKTVAFSPDDRLIASGSEDGHVLLSDGKTGAFVRQLPSPGGVVGNAAIEGLAFSPDGKWLLFSSVFAGCHIYDIESGKELRDGKLGDGKPVDGATGDIFDFTRTKCNGGIAFSPGGRFAVASFNSVIHLLDPTTGKAIKTFQGSGKRVDAVGVARDGRAIAWGSKDLAGQTGPDRLTRRLRLPSEGAPLAIPEKFEAAPVSTQQPARKVSGDHPRPGTDLRGGSPTPQGDSGANSSWGVYEAPPPVEGNYTRRNSKHGPLSVKFKSIDGFAVNVRYLEISKDGTAQTQIDLGAAGASSARGLSPISFTQDGQTVLIGLHSRIEAYDLRGRWLGKFTGHSNGELRDLAPSGDGRFLVSGGSDQTVRLWNLQTRELIVSLFHGDDGEWVVWTPQGYYASSPNGDRIVGWQINKGPEQAAEYVTANQLRNKFYRPDIVERAIVLASAAKAVEEVDPARAGGFQLSDLAQRLPPKLAVISSRDRGATSNGRTVIQLSLAEASGDPVDTFQAFVNDTKVTAAAKRDGGTVSFEVPLAQGNNRIRLVVRSKADLLAEAQLDVVQRGEGALDIRNTLYIVAIGADKYPQLPRTCGQKRDMPCDLAFAGADAKVFAATIEKQMGGQHKRIVKRVLFNGAGGDLEPTRANVENVLDTLLQAKDNDTVAVFIAGHGLNDARTGYQFLPSDARFADGANLASSSVIKWSVLEGAIQSAKGRRLLFVDTCRSTNAFNNRLMKDASDEAIVAFSATNTQQDAVELADLGHGAFTSAVVKGLNGAADIAQEQEVRVFDLGAYVEREVRKLTKGLQTPDFYKKPGAENFVLARLPNASAAIPPAGRQGTLSELKAVSRDERPVQPSPPVVSVPPEQPAAAAPPPPAQVMPTGAPPRLAEVKPMAALPPAAEVKPAAAPPPAPAAVKPAGLSISPSEEAERLKSGQAALALDDWAAARLIFEYLAAHGSAAGAYQLGQTYDPQFLARTPMGALFKPDAKIAESWYVKAAELGHAEARKRLSASK